MVYLTCKAVVPLTHGVYLAVFYSQDNGDVLTYTYENGPDRPGMEAGKVYRVTVEEVK